MNIDRKYAGWVFGIISTTIVTFVFAEDRWNQKEQIQAAEKAGNGTAYLMYSTVVKGLKRDVKRLKLKPNPSQEEKVEIEELEDEILEIKDHQKGLLK